MKKFNWKQDAYAIFIILLGIGLTIWAYPKLPDRIPIHWNFNGEVDNYTTKFKGTFITLFFAAAIYLGFHLKLIIDPLKENYKRFSKKYRLTRDILVTFFVVLNLLPVLNSLGYIENMSKAIFILISLLMILIGNYMPSFKRNWFLGIKTPWTVSNEEIWNKTHRLGGKLFVVAGILGLIESLFLGSTYIFFIAIMLASFGSMFYSYLLYRNLD